MSSQRVHHQFEFGRLTIALKFDGLHHLGIGDDGAALVLIKPVVLKLIEFLYGIVPSVFRRSPCVSRKYSSA